jgi:hypothetical protein
LKPSICASLWAELIRRMHLEISCENRHHGWLINKYLNCSASQSIKPRLL